MKLPIVCVVTALTVSMPASGQVTTRASLDSRGLESSTPSDAATLSRDGRFVSYVSGKQVYVYDRASGVRELISANLSGLPGNGASGASHVSPNGLSVFFESTSDDLLVGDLNLSSDVFVRDRVLAKTKLLSLDWAGNPIPFHSLLGGGDESGSRALFTTWANGVVPGDQNNYPDLFLRDCAAGTTTQVNVSSNGQPANVFALCCYPFMGSALSADGNYAVFSTFSSNLVPNDTNGVSDVFVRDLTGGTTAIVSMSSSGAYGNERSMEPAVSADGRFVAFASFASNLVPNDANGAKDIFLHDRLTLTTSRVSVDSSGGEANGGSLLPSISDDGRFIAFASAASNLVPQDTNGTADVFRHDRLTGSTVRVSVDSAGKETPPPHHNDFPAISGDGRYVGFNTKEEALVIRDKNGVSDVFVRDTSFACPLMSLYCTTKKNSAGCGPKIGVAGAPTLSGTSAFFLIATKEVNRKPGLLFWGLSPKSTPFFGGTLCVQAPQQRTPVQDSGGSVSGTDCTGTYSFAFDAPYMKARGLTAGTTVYAQYWSLDNAPFKVGLTDAIQFTVCP